MENSVKEMSRSNNTHLRIGLSRVSGKVPEGSPKLEAKKGPVEAEDSSWAAGKPFCLAEDHGVFKQEGWAFLCTVCRMC